MAFDMQAVQLRAAHERPYFALVIYAATIVERPGLGTFAVDKHCRIYVDPDMLGSGTGKWNVAQAAWVFIHEIGHWLRSHHERAEALVAAEDCQNCAAALINVCEDAELNCDPDLERGLPGDFVHPTKLGLEPHKLWEEYYAALRKKGGRRPCSGGGDHEPGAPQPGAGNGKLRDCGSGAHGQPRDWEEPAPDGAQGEIPGIGEGEATLLRKAVAREVADAARKDRGSVPAGWQLWADAVLTPPAIPWERELAALMHSAITMASGCVDYSYARPSRRGTSGGVIQPALRRPQPEATVVLDTSGSMSKLDITAALSEIDGILRAVGQRRVPVICCDAQAAPVQRVSRAMSVQLTGGGGTDMGVGIAAAVKIKSRVIIVLTDGATPWPPQPPPGAQLVVGIVRPANAPKLSCTGVPNYVKRVLTIPVAA